MRKWLLLSLTSALLLHNISAQDRSDTLSLNKVAWIGGLGYTATLAGLSTAWYGENGFTSFRFFNDNAEWNQVDKIGHLYGTYHFSRISYSFLKRTKLTDKKALYWSAGLGAAMLLPVEILDGFSQDYGFSYGDIIANMAGSALFLGQELLWSEQRIKIKYSFRQTEFPQFRPSLLGDGLHEEFLKDYNGQTYWLSFDIHAFMPQSKFPKWINLAVGYGAEGMVFSRAAENQLAGFNSYRQYYFGIDFDLSHIPTKNKFLKTVLFLADLIRLPAPAIEINKNGVQAHLFSY